MMSLSAFPSQLFGNRFPRDWRYPPKRIIPQLPLDAYVEFAIMADLAAMMIRPIHESRNEKSSKRSELPRFHNDEVKTLVDLALGFRKRNIFSDNGLAVSCLTIAIGGFIAGGVLCEKFRR
jgi:hypothetical protein